MKTKLLGCLAGTAMAAAIVVATPALAQHAGGGMSGGGMHFGGGVPGGGMRFGGGVPGGGMHFGGGVQCRQHISEPDL